MLGADLTRSPTPRRWAGGSLDPHEVDALCDGYPVVFSDFLGPRLANACSASVRELYDTGHLSPAAMGEARRLRPDVRGDHSAWSADIEPNSALGALARAFESLGETVGAQTRISIPHFDLQIACYPGGGTRYRQHVDAGRPESVRRITAICYLNPRWCDAHGGVLRCLTPTGDRFVEPSLDRLVVFRSDELVHEVLPSHALRFAVTAWFRGVTTSATATPRRPHPRPRGG